MVGEIKEIENGKMKINCLGCIFGASIEDYDVCMAQMIDKLISERDVTSIALQELKEHEYDEKQTNMLIEIAQIIREIIETDMISEERIGVVSNTRFPKWYPWLSSAISYQLRGDPLGAYVNIKREIRHLEILRKKMKGRNKDCIEKFLNDILIPICKKLENTELIKRAMPFIDGYKIGNRNIYRKIFQPLTRPNFMFTKYISQFPLGELVKKYNVGDTKVFIFKIPGKIRYYYHAILPEFDLSENEYIILDDAMHVLEARRPRELEIQDQKRMRRMFHNISLELVKDVSKLRGVNLSPGEITKLAGILTRYTAGLGIIETLLSDEMIQDININSPIGRIPLYIIHQEYEECETNLLPSPTDADRWATRFKLLSGRPLDESNPVLDTEMILPKGMARVAAIAPRVSPDGLAFALRRHRFNPWTFPLYLNVGYFDPLFAGLMWFVTTYGRTILVGGTRGSGKTSLLGSLMLQIPPIYRIISSEDTFELPMTRLKELGYNVQRLKSRSVITRSEMELPAEEVIRTALRLGDSCLFIGEIRSTEAKALFEAMRIGALANVVAGTIHGESAYGIFDRVVNDLGVPITSFKAADLVVVCNKLRRPGELRTFRRVVELTEVRKHWQKDPMEENGFINLMEYSAKGDKLEPTGTLLNGESYVLNQIAKRIPEWHGRWDAVWDNINLRANIMKTIKDIAVSTNHLGIMEASYLVKSNQLFESISHDCKEEVGVVDSKIIYDKWLKEFKKIIKRPD